MLALNGAIWTSGAVLTGVHTFHTKTLKAEPGAALAAVQLVAGAAMIGRAIQLDRNSVVGDKIF